MLLLHLSQEGPSPGVSADDRSSMNTVCAFKVVVYLFSSTNGSQNKSTVNCKNKWEKDCVRRGKPVTVQESRCVNEVFT